MKKMHPTLRRIAGYTLIELMIALTLGAFLIGGILQLYIGSKRSYNTQSALTELQEIGRFALNSMVGDIRMAGFFGCGASNTAVNVLNNGTDWEWDVSTPVRGYEGDATSSAAPADFRANVVANTDALKIIRADPSGDYVVDSHSTVTGTLTLKENHDLQLDQLLMITDCLNTSVFQMRNANPSNNISQVLHTNTGTSPGNCTSGLGAPLTCTAAGTSYQYAEDSFLMPMVMRTYFVGTGVSGRSALFRLSLNAGGTLGTPVELADGVTDLQLVYGVDTDADGAADTYAQASAVSAANWANVVSVQINVLVVSGADRLADDPQSYILFDGSAASLNPVTPADNRLRRVFSTTVNIRNRTVL